MRIFTQTYSCLFLCKVVNNFVIHIPFFLGSGFNVIGILLMLKLEHVHVIVNGLQLAKPAAVLTKWRCICPSTNRLHYLLHGHGGSLVIGGNKTPLSSGCRLTQV